MKKLFYLALAALMVLVVSCKKDEARKNSIVLAGVGAAADVSISESELDGGVYHIVFDFSTNDSRKTLTLVCTSSLDGKKIDLTKVIDSAAGSWDIMCYGEGGHNLFWTSSSSTSPNGYFQSGTLQIRKGRERAGVIDFSIILKKGKTRGTADNNDLSLEIDFNGPVKTVESFE